MEAFLLPFWRSLATMPKRVLQRLGIAQGARRGQLGKIHVYRDDAGEYRWQMKADNRKVESDHGIRYRPG